MWRKRKQLSTFQVLCHTPVWTQILLFWPERSPSAWKQTQRKKKNRLRQTQILFHMDVQIRYNWTSGQFGTPPAIRGQYIMVSLKHEQFAPFSEGYGNMVLEAWTQKLYRELSLRHASSGSSHAVRLKTGACLKESSLYRETSLKLRENQPFNSNPSVQGQLPCAVVPTYDTAKIFTCRNATENLPTGGSLHT